MELRRYRFRGEQVVPSSERTTELHYTLRVVFRGSDFARSQTNTHPQVSMVQWDGGPTRLVETRGEGFTPYRATMQRE